MKLVLLGLLIAFLCVTAITAATGVATAHYTKSSGRHFGAPSVAREQSLKSRNAFSRSTERRSSSALQKTEILNSTTTTQSLAAGLCPYLLDHAVTELFLEVDTSDMPASPIRLPECFYHYISSVIGITMSHVTINGNSTIPDPFSRLGTSISQSATFLRFESSTIATENGVQANISWSSFFDAFPQLQWFYFVDSNLGNSFQLPSTLPTSLLSITITNCDLQGSIPSSLLNNISSTSSELELRFNQNNLTGTLPPTLFNDDLLNNLRYLTIDLSINSLEGTFPDGFFSSLGASLTNMQAFALDLGANLFEGPVQNILPTTGNFFTSGIIETISIILDSNRFDGELIFWSTGVGSGLQTFTFSAVDNAISGSIPSDWISSLGLSSRMNELTIDLKGNHLIGDIPTGLFDFSANSACSPRIWDISLANNHLDGTISSSLFAPINWTLVSRMEINVGSNQLYGDFPSTLFSAGQSAPRLSSIFLFFSNLPKLTGTIPSIFLPSLLTSQNSSTSTYVVLDFTRTKLTGALNFIDFSMRPQPLQLAFSALEGNFTSVSFSVSNSLAFLDLRSNPLLTGNLPDHLFGSNSKLNALLASSTQLTGMMPNMGVLAPTSLTNLDLASTGIDFCGGSRTRWSSSISQCNLTSTSASTCSSMYPPQCLGGAPVPLSPPISPPTVTPVTPTAPTVPPTAPVAPSCSESTRPSPSFVCINGTWTSTSSVTTPTLVIPSGATQTVVNGNLTSAQVIIQGLGSSVVVQGCVSNLTDVTVELTPAELERIGKTGKTQQSLLRYNSSDPSCNSTLDSVVVSTQVKGSSCRKVKVDEVKTTGSLSALFTVDSSKCNLWWIILVSVLCGVVILGALIAVIVFVVLKNRSYSRHERRLKQAAL